jgi:hypothetical protein
MAIHLLKFPTCPPTERRSPLRFMGLPVDIQYMILEHAGLVEPGPVIASFVTAYVHGDIDIDGLIRFFEICCWSLCEGPSPTA